MKIPHCHVCNGMNEYPTASDLEEGEYCPICYNPTCRRHLAVVRYRWKNSRDIHSELICKTCKTTYRHRYWDTAQRDWIS